MAAASGKGQGASVCPTSPFDEQRAYRDLVRQCGFGPRVPGSRAHARCAGWLAEQLRASCQEVHLQPFTATVAGKALALTNIVGVINPKGRGHVLLCAHWDSRPLADRDPDREKRTKPVPGANDGASGVAVLLEIARALKACPPRQRVTIVLFDGEDYGQRIEDMLLGSRDFAKRFTGPRVSWGVLLDMVGDRDLRLPVEGNSQRLAPRVVDRVWRAAARAGSTAFVRQPGPAVMDDHLPLLTRGIPCVDVIDFEYPHWHTTADTPDKCSAASLGQVGRAVLRAMAEE
jgi:Zn-dependent M28 family amino/carboxypeptidase